MAEETSDANTVNLDLNLGPDTEPLSGAVPDEAIILDDSIDEPFNRTSDHHHHHHGHDHDELHEINSVQQAPQYPYLWPHSRDTISLELDELLENSSNGSVLQAGEGSVAAEERAAEVPKACEIGNSGVALDETSEKKEDVEKGGGVDAGFFNCNICFDMAKDPVVTCCGHLFCWPCLYKWLHLQSHTKKGCPVCKREVNVKSVTPIYGCGNNARVHEEEDSNLKIPVRPSARCVSEDSTVRPTGRRNVAYMPAEERIRVRHPGSRQDLNQDLVQRHEQGNARQTPERTSSSSWWNRIQEPRGARTVHNLRGEPQDGAVSSTQNNLDVPLAAGNRPLRVRAFFNTATLNYAVRVVEPNFGSNPIGRNQEQPPSVEDRDSSSSIAAVINSGSQVHTAHNLWRRPFY